MGDGTPVETITSDSDPKLTHSYASGGTYTIDVKGTMQHFAFKNLGSKDMITDIKRWGTFKISVDEFNGCINLASISATDIPALDNTLTRAFQGCSSLTSIDMSNWDFSQVTEIPSLFSGCTSLQALDFTGLDVSKIVNISSFLKGCTSITTFDGTVFNGNKLYNLSTVFDGCTNLATLDVSGWDTSEVVAMQSMFRSCGNLTTIDVSNWDVSNVTNMSSLFSGCGVNSLDMSNWQTNSLVTIATMFASMTNIDTIDISNFNVTKCTILQNLFLRSSVKHIIANGLDTSNIENFNGTFRECRSLASLDIRGWSTPSATDLSMMFANIPIADGDFNGLRDLASWDTSKVENFGRTFNSVNFNPDLTNWNTDSATNMDVMITDSVNFNRDVSGWNITQVTALDEFCRGATLDTTFYDAILVSWHNQLETAFPGGVGYTPTIIINFGLATQYTSGSAAEAARTALANDFNWTITDGGALVVAKVDNIQFDIDTTLGTSNDFVIPLNLGNVDIEVDWGDGNTSLITSYNSTLKTHTYATPGIYTIDIKGTADDFGFKGVALRREMVTNIKRWGEHNLKPSAFSGCTNLTTISATDAPIMGADISGVFRNCVGLTSFDGTGWDTSNVTTMSNLFYGCTHLITVDISNFNTSKLIDFSNVFIRCEALTTINAGGLDTSKVENFNGVFNLCKELVNLNISGWNTSSATNFSSMFVSCEKLTSLDLSTWNTSNATNMSSMFQFCRALTSLDISGFNTSNVINFSGMFRLVTVLPSIDLTHFNTSKATDMNGMFWGYTNFNGDISSFNTSLVTIYK